MKGSHGHAIVQIMGGVNNKECSKYKSDRDACVKAGCDPHVFDNGLVACIAPGKNPLDLYYCSMFSVSECSASGRCHWDDKQNKCVVTDQNKQNGDNKVKSYKPEGNLGYVNCSKIEGWAWDKDTPNNPIQVHLYKDASQGDNAQFVMSLTANVHRPDLKNVTNDNLNHGFSIQTPVSLKDGKNHKIYAYGIDVSTDKKITKNNKLLNGGGQVLRCAQ